MIGRPSGWALGLGTVVATVAAAAAQQEPQAPPVFRARTTAVSLDVSVKRGNRPVPGLTVGTLVLLLAAALAGVARAAAQRSAEPDELLSLYDRGAWEAFDERLRAFAAAPGSVRAFRRAADRWIDAGPSAEQRRLIAAAVAVELATVLCA